MRSIGLKYRPEYAGIKYWLEKDFIDKEVKTGVIILPTIGCSHARDVGCTMCGYIHDSPKKFPMR